MMKSEYMSAPRQGLALISRRPAQPMTSMRVGQKGEKSALVWIHRDPSLRPSRPYSPRPIRIVRSRANTRPILSLEFSTYTSPSKLLLTWVAPSSKTNLSTSPPKLPPWPPKEPEIIAPFKRSQTTPAFLENSVEGTGLGDGSATPQPIREKPQVRRTKSFSWNYDSENSTASNVTLSEATSIFVYEEDDSDPALRLSLIKHL